MSWFWKGLFLGHLLTRGSGAPKEPASPSALDPEETYRCGHCNAQVHADDKYCHFRNGILTDEYKVVEITYTKGQVWGPVVVFIGLKAVCG